MRVAELCKICLNVYKKLAYGKRKFTAKMLPLKNKELKMPRRPRKEKKKVKFEKEDWESDSDEDKEEIKEPEKKIGSNLNLNRTPLKHHDVEDYLQFKWNVRCMMETVTNNKQYNL